MSLPPLTPQALGAEAYKFSVHESTHSEPSLYGVNDGKAIGTYLEHKLRSYLQRNYEFVLGNSASGIDFPGLNIDMKVTSIKQPQSSCPYRSARQKIYGLGYGLLIFVYDKADDHTTQTACLRMVSTVYVDPGKTADFQMTNGLRNILANSGNADDLMAFMMEKNLPVDEIELNNLAREIIANPPELGFLTISNALQWRLQYSRVIEFAGKESGLTAIYRS